MSPIVLVHGFKKSQIVLVHGNANGIEFELFGRHKKYADFLGFKNEIDIETAKIYRWHYINQKYNLLNTLNLFKFSQLYFEERKYCSNPNALKTMQEFIEIEQPTILLGHSLGAFQIFNYLNNFDIPSSLKKIVFVQGAFPSHEKITNPKIIQRIENKSLVIENYHSPFDQMLWIYTIAHFHQPGGLYGAKDTCISNIEYTRFGPGNPHLWTVHNREFAQQILGLLM